MEKKRKKKTKGKEKKKKKKNKFSLIFFYFDIYPLYFFIFWWRNFSAINQEFVL